MKKLFALLLVLIMAVTCATSCKFLGIGDDNSDGGTNEGTNNGTGTTDDTDDEFTVEEDDGDVDTKDNMDPDAWIKVDK